MDFYHSLKSENDKSKISRRIRKILTTLIVMWIAFNSVDWIVNDLIFKTPQFKGVLPTDHFLYKSYWLYTSHYGLMILLALLLGLFLRSSLKLKSSTFNQHR